MKICTKCNIPKEEKEFGKDKNGKNGLKSRCKQCMCKSNKEYNILNPERNKIYYENNKEEILNNAKDYYQENKEDILPKQKEYQKQNPEISRKGTAKWIKANPEYHNNYRRNRYKNDPEFRIRIILSSRINSSLKKYKIYKSNKSEKLLGCTFEEFKLYIEKQFTKDMTWKNHGIVWELDHKLPCSSFNLNLEEEQYKCFHYSNNQPLLKQENRQKSSKII